ncbi:class I SAM-dependent methyltransferase [Vibrio cholerae]|uniref:class I SAM-dependent methyltransferase n=1 Tax=Vibrio cholerae TaxID=666 RepID=UPI001EB19EC1|nr:class I SAM-dependent methyltransferase [Vibrio cholerae]EHZ7431587.1 class I SAM-dependent methyltransferase [Vibrio cholerae]EJI2332220.1 class I SAM-dependent methyltransferase [Vibrio cholerae]EJL6364730.1 class I SAM-dependent methyltransferase [Vibrio cholerae]EKF9139938.1 class I SAM-dependent methyltransferase [Vibrio cholerae]ELK6278391.1 class I SAM-dependent methyltransferase [Vibrio cholerae]
MALQRMTKRQYAEHWAKETENFDQQGIYERLAEITPKERTLEIGCGTGVTTRYLAEQRCVLAVDNNEYLIEKSASSLESVGSSAKIIHADIFELSSESRSVITGFKPKVITGWFIGSHPDDQDKWAGSDLPLDQKPKKYRENIEDIITQYLGSIESVEWIHLVNRVVIAPEFSDKDIIDGTIAEYDENVFSSHGFEVVEVQVINWDTSKSGFMYVNSNNPNYAGGTPLPRFISILAKKKVA